MFPRSNEVVLQHFRVAHEQVFLLRFHIGVTALAIVE